MGNGHRNFPKLKGASNIESWRMDIQSSLIIDGLWKYADGSKVGPTEPDKPDDKATPEIISKYEADLSNYGLQKSSWDDKHELACAYIILSLEPAIRIYLAGVVNSKEALEILDARYRKSDLASIDTYLSNIMRSTQDQFESLDEYYQHVQTNHKQLVDLGKVVPEWILASAFRHGLNPRFQSLVFNLQHAAKTNDIELSMDDVFNYLQECESYLKDHESARTLPATRPNQSNDGSSSNSRSRQSKRGKRGRGGRGCGGRSNNTN